MSDQLRAYFPNLFSGGTVSSSLTIVLIIAVIAFLYYLIFAKKNYKNPFWALVVLVVGIAVFLGFFYGGIKLGKIFGLGELGAFAGIFAFFFFATVYKYYSTPKDQRRKKFM